VSSSPDSTLCALVADDDPVVCAFAAAALRSLGFEVQEAPDGASALEAAQRSMPDLIVLDVRMPRMDGFEACEALRQLPGGAEVPILIVTGSDDFPCIDRAFEAGATDFIMKPINLHLLQHRVRFQMRASHAFREVHKTLGELRASEHRLARSQQLARLGEWEWDVEGDCLLLSEQAMEIIGCEACRPTTLATFLESCVYPDDRELAEKQLLEASQAVSNVEFDHRAVDGERVVHHFLEATESVPGGGRTLVGTVQDITDRRQAEERIRQLAFFDSLTGLPNRRVLEERLTRAIAYSDRSKTQLALLFLDLDRFKRINDTLGHMAGDELLKEVAEILLASVRGADSLGGSPSNSRPQSSVARFGGDEFGIVLSGLRDAQDAGKVARRLGDLLRKPFILQGREVKVTASIGIATYPADADDAEALFRSADMAMYHAKENGRDSYQFFSASMNEAALRAMNMELTLAEALEQDRLLLHYQPLVKTGSGEIVAAEALIRMRGDGGKLVPPGAFIPVAEESGLIVPLGTWVLRTACAQLARWRSDGWANGRICVNVSTLQLQRRDFIATVGNAISDAGLEPQAVELEITEGIFVEERSGETIQQLRQMGVSVALDDFGTGFSSLSYLKRVPVDTIKIDRAFIREIESGGGTLVTAIIALARQLGCEVVAEGIETAEELEFVTQHQCDLVQGFHLARPVPEDEFRWQAAEPDA
jgi:diguanylate cyclase (GGDEF)-like protein